jgi:tRNA modification GTPase
MNNEIIVAQATAHGPAALAIIRLSGDNIRLLLDQSIILRSKKKLVTVETHTLHYGFFYNKNNELIDQVIFAVMDAPRSFTGEHTIEITCHNNQFIIQAIIHRCIELGARLAKPGEFSERAVFNKKIDLLQAEAINELLHAQNELTTKLALSQVEGSLSAEINTIDNQLCTISAWCQASFEFLDEERDFRNTILEKISITTKKIDSLIHMYSYHKFLKEGVRIAIIGSVNTGKSSLFNRLVGYQRAIVSNTPGTTRDTIESTISHNNYHITFIDTAGIRITDDSIEQEGIRKSYQEASLADLILLVYTENIITEPDINFFYQNILKQYQAKTIIIKNKIDEKNTTSFFDSELLTSTTKDKNIKSILAKIEEYIEKKYTQNNISYIINMRHFENLNQIKSALHNIENMLRTDNPFYEIILYHLLDTQKIINNLSGKSIEERSLDKVFREFCVGK